MAIKTLVAATLLAALGTANATRVIDLIENAFELSLADLTLPTAANGGVSFRRCADCAFTTHVLQASTQFRVNNQDLPFEEFIRVANELRADSRTREATFAGVFIDIDSGRVTRVVLVH
jgi:hypothetical protein